MTEPMVTILSAHCEECGRSHRVQPPKLIALKARPQDFKCICGGRIVFALAGAGVSDA